MHECTSTALALLINAQQNIASLLMHMKCISKLASLLVRVQCTDKKYDDTYSIYDVMYSIYDVMYSIYDVMHITVFVEC